jgi:Carboxypeptidase regulatory-like domain/TonB dependent receptor
MMTRILASLAVGISLCVATVAGVSPGSISGYVRDSGGVAQMGATVEVAGNAGQHLIAFTDTKGFFRISGLPAGSYDLRVSAPSFIPALREDVALAAGASKVVNITLNTLFEAIRMVPELKRSADEDDSWKWTLRSTANRPILRFEAGAPVIVESAQQDRSTKGTMAFMAGGSSEGYGSAADLGTAFNVEHSLFHTSVVSLAGDLGYPGGAPDGIVRATYRRKSDDGWTPSVAFTVRRFSAPDEVPHGGALQALSMFYSDGFSIGDLLDIQVAGDAAAVQFLGKEVNAFRPAGTADLHLTPDLILEYRYTTEEPNTRASKGFDTAPADLSENAPRMTMVDGAPLMENAHHHEVSLSQRFGNTKVQVAYFNDRIKDPALLGAGDIGIGSDDILPDVYSGTFSYNGGMLEAQGVRLVLQRRLSNGITATVDYAYGGVLDLEQPYVGWSTVRSDLEHVWRHSAALKLNGGIPHCKTRWIASYRWTSGDNTLTPVDLFNASAGQADPYFNLFLRQPLPHVHGMPLNMEAIIDLRNLLAQGYVPVIGPDGKTVYLMQSARSVRGGLAFSF